MINSLSIMDLMDRPIAYHRCFVQLGAGVIGAVLLSQAVYWSRRTTQPGGWFYKSQADWEEETGLKRTEQEKARKALTAIGVLEEIRKGIPAKLYFRVNEQKLISVLTGSLDIKTADEFISAYTATLKGLSKAGYMRAHRAGMQGEYFEYAEAIKTHGMICACCKSDIRPSLSGEEALTFVYLVQMEHGGTHSIENLRPIHVKCTGVFSEQNEANKSALDESGKNAYGKQTGLLSVNEQACLPKAVILTENTTENTTETTADIFNAADKAASEGEGEAVPAVLSEPQQAKSSENMAKQKTRLVWMAYSSAYFKRYGTEPVSNAKVNSQISQLVKRLGEEASLVAEFYVLNVNERFVAQKMHPLGLLLSSAESYRTQWATGRAMTQTRAQQIDSTQANASAADEAIAMLRARDQGAYHS